MRDERIFRIKRFSYLLILACVLVPAALMSVPSAQASDSCTLQNPCLPLNQAFQTSVGTGGAEFDCTEGTCVRAPNTATSQPGAVGIEGVSYSTGPDAIGVHGILNPGFGGELAGTNAAGVTGTAAGRGIGVLGTTVGSHIGGYGVVGRADGPDAALLGDNTGSGDGSEGKSVATGRSGLYAHHDGANAGYGVFAKAETGTGVVGTTSSGSGFGVFAENTGGGVALKASGKSTFTGAASFGSTETVTGQTKLNGGMAVSGKTSFSRSGVITLSSSAATATKSGVSLTSSSYVLATLQTDTVGLYIRSAVPNPGSSSITIHFNTNAPSGTKVAWFVVN